MEKVNVKHYLGKEVSIEIDRPLGTRHPKHGFMYMINYGFFPNTISGDGDKLIVLKDGKDYSDDAMRSLTGFQEKYLNIQQKYRFEIQDIKCVSK